MDINDPRYRLRVLNQSNPSIRIASAPQKQPQIRVSNSPVRAPQIQIAGSGPVQNSAPQQNSWSTPEAPKRSGWGGFFNTLGNIGKGVVHPFAEFGNAAIHVPQAVYREARNKPIGDIQQNVFGTQDPGRIAKKIVSDTAQIGLTAAIPGAGASSNLATRAGIDAAIGAGYGGSQAFGENKNLREILKSTAVGGALGGVFAPVAKVAGKIVGGLRGGDIAKKIARESSAAKIASKYGIPDEAAHFLSKESNPETVRAVVEQLHASGIPITDWVQSSKVNAASSSSLDNPNARISGTFDPSNPPQSALPPGMHPPNAADPVEVLSKQATSAKSAEDFASKVSKLTGEDKAVADSALNGKTPEEFYNAVKGDSGMPAFQRGYGGTKVSKTESDIQKAIASTGTPAFMRKQAAHDSSHMLPPGPDVVTGEGFTMKDSATPGIQGMTKQLNKLDQKISDIAEGKVSTTREEAVALQKERQDLVDKIVNPEAKPTAKPAEAPAVAPSGTSAPAVKGDIAPEAAAPSDVGAKSTPVATPQNATPDATSNASPAVEQVLGKLDEASRLYNPEAKAFSKQRGAALYRGGDAAKEAGGMAGHVEQLKALKGVKKQTGFQPIEVTPEVRDEVMTQIHNSDLLPGDRLSANTGMLKVFGHISGAPTPSERKLIRQALGNDVADAIDQNIELAGMTGREKLAMVAATPKAAMATADISAPLRQGGVLGARFPKQFAENTAQAVKYFGSPKAFEEHMAQVRGRANYEVYQKMGLHVDAAEGLMGTEESLMTSILQTDAAKKVLVGHVASASDRAYSGFLTKFRADVADKIIGDLKTSGVFDQMDDHALKSLGKFINTASGRGDLGSLERHAGLLSKALFSPRLWKSRLDLLNPVYYAKLDPIARKYALQTSAAFASVAGTILGLAAMAGATVVWDPRSADFAKIKVGNTRYDILGGLQQNIRLGAQMVTGEKIDSSTGEIATLGADRGFGKPSRKDLLYQFFENKENPLLGYAGKLLEGTDPAGNPINAGTEALKLFTPLNVQSVIETAKDTGNIPKSIGMNIPGFFGAGVQTYGNVASKNKGSDGEWKGKITPEMVTGMDGQPIIDDKGRPVKVKFPDGASDLEKQAIINDARDKAYNKVAISMLSKDDAALYNIGNKDKSLLDAGQLDKYNEIKKWVQSYGATTKVPDGAKSELSQDFYKKFNTMTKKDQDYWLEKGKPEEFSKQITKLLNKERSDGLSEFKPSNAIAKAYSEYEKDLNTHPEYTDVDKRNKAKEFQKFAYKLNYNQTQRDLFTEGSSSDTRTLVDNGQISKEDLDAAIKMDDELYNSGLTGTLKFSKKFRREYGYGLPSGGKGPNRGGSGTRSGSTKSENAHLEAFVPSFSQGTKAGDTPSFSRKSRTTPSFKNVSLPKGPPAPKVNINL